MLTERGLGRYSKTTRRAAFLAEMNRVMPCLVLCALIEPVYPKAGKRAGCRLAWRGCCAFTFRRTGSICPIPLSKKRFMHIVFWIYAPQPGVDLSAGAADDDGVGFTALT